MNVLFGPDAFVPTVAGAICNVLTSICRTTEKAVVLVENEVDNLDAEQKLRLAAIAKQRTAPKQSKAA